MAGSLPAAMPVAPDAPGLCRDVPAYPVAPLFLGASARRRPWRPDPGGIVTQPGQMGCYGTVVANPHDVRRQVAATGKTIDTQSGEERDP